MRALVPSRLFGVHAEEMRLGSGLLCIDVVDGPNRLYMFEVRELKNPVNPTKCVYRASTVCTGLILHNYVVVIIQIPRGLMCPTSKRSSLRTAVLQNTGVDMQSSQEHSIGRGRQYPEEMQRSYESSTGATREERGVVGYMLRCS